MLEPKYTQQGWFVSFKVPEGKSVVAKTVAKLPQCFIQVTHSGARIQATTVDCNNDRIEGCLGDIFVIMDTPVTGLPYAHRKDRMHIQTS